jgi:hypothetical protein
MRALIFVGCMVAGLILPGRYHPQIDRVLEWATRSRRAA